VCAVEVVVVVVVQTIPRYPEVRFPFPARKGTGGRVPGKENSTCTRRLEVCTGVRISIYRTIDPASAPQFLADSTKEHEDHPASISPEQPSCHAEVQNLRPSRTTRFSAYHSILQTQPYIKLKGKYQRSAQGIIRRREARRTNFPQVPHKSQLHHHQEEGEKAPARL
jgi:hypothetical protein